jgi:hypothetical protein
VTGIDRVVLFATISWMGLWVHELHRVPALFGFTPDGDLFMLPVVAGLAIWWVLTHSTGAVVQVRNQRPDDTALLFHLLVPARRWWDDIIFT